MFGGPNPFGQLMQQVPIQQPNQQSLFNFPQINPEMIPPMPDQIEETKEDIKKEEGVIQLSNKIQSQNIQYHPGKVIDSRCSMYYTIGDKAQLLPQDLALSIDLKSTKCKVYQRYEKSLIVFATGEHDLTLLINQVDQIQNILKPLHTSSVLHYSNIIDFTLLNFSQLYLLSQGQITILDLSKIIKKQSDSPQFVERIDLAAYPLLYRIDAIQDDKFLILIHKNKAQFDQLEVASKAIVHSYTIPNEEQRSIRDIDYYKHFICVLYDKNEIIVYQSQQRSQILKVKYDSVGSIQRLFYVEEFNDDLEWNEDMDRFKDDDILDDDENLQGKSITFKGNFLLIENQNPDPQSKGKLGGASPMKTENKNVYFEKLHLAKVQQELVGDSLQYKIKLQDFLKISESNLNSVSLLIGTAKFVEYDKKRGLVFLLNKETPTQSLKLYNVKLKSPSFQEYQFGFIKELKLNLQNSLIQSLKLSSGSKKPKFIKFIRKPFEDSNNPEVFYFYCAIGASILAHSTQYSDLIENHDKIESYKLHADKENSNKSDKSQNDFLQMIQKISDNTQNEFDEDDKVKNTFNPEIPDEDQFKQEVTQELEKKILEDLNNFENPLVINDDKEEFKDDTELMPKRKSSKSNKRPAVVVQEQIQVKATPPPSQIQQPEATTSKKKKKKANKDNNNKQPPAPQVQSQVIKDKDLSFIQPKPMPQQNQVNNNSGKKQGGKSQQEQLVENYKDLNKKYVELSQKMQKLQEQMQSQVLSQRQVDLDLMIQNHLKKYLPQLIEEEMKKNILPTLVQHLKGIDKSVQTEIMPMIEAQIESILTKLITNKQIGQSSGTQQMSSNVSDEVVKQIIMEEFQNAMIVQIKPMLEQSFKSLIDEVMDCMRIINNELSNKLKIEEERNQFLLQYYLEKIGTLTSYPQQPPPQLYQPPPAYMSPPPYYQHPQYQPLPPQYFNSLQPQVSYPTTKSVKNQILPNQAELKRLYSYQQQQFVNQFNGKNKSFSGDKHDNYSDDAGDELNEMFPQKNKSGSGGVIEGNADDEEEKKPIVEQINFQFQSQLQQKIDKPVLIYNDENEQKQNSPQKKQVDQGKSQLLQQTLAQQPKIQQKPPQIQPMNLSSQNILSQLMMQQQPMKKEPTNPSKNEYQDVINYIKAVANGKPQQIDFVLTNNGFFQKTLDFLNTKAAMLNSQHENIVYQFQKKIYDRAKSQPQLRQKGYQLFMTVLNKACKNRQELQQRLSQIEQMGREIKLQLGSSQSNVSAEQLLFKNQS